jgi:acetyltransferase
VKQYLANEAEFALVVADRWQRHGLGVRLLELLVRFGRDEKLDRITATILPENSDMQLVARKVGFALRQEQGECSAVLAL